MQNPAFFDRGELITFEGIECSGKGTQIKLIEKWLNDRQRLYVVEAEPNNLKHELTPEQANQVRDLLGLKKFKFLSDHEPGGTIYGEALRAILKNPDLALPAIYETVRQHSDYEGVRDFVVDNHSDFSRNGKVEIFLFMASRAAFAEKLKPLINNGTIVLADRLMDSTTAYQGYGKLQGNPESLETINTLNRFALDGLWPYLTFYIDIPIETMYERMSRQSDEKNSFFEKKYNRDFYERVRNGYLRIAELEPSRVKIIDGTKTIEEVFADITTILDRVL